MIEWYEDYAMVYALQDMDRVEQLPGEDYLDFEVRVYLRLAELEVQ